MVYLKPNFWVVALITCTKKACILVCVVSLYAAGEVHGASEAAEETAGGGRGREFTHKRPAQKTAARAGGNGRQHAEHDTRTQQSALPAQVTPAQWLCTEEMNVNAYMSRCARLLYPASVLSQNIMFFLFMRVTCGNCVIFLYTFLCVLCVILFCLYLTYLHVCVCPSVYVCI